MDLTEIVSISNLSGLYQTVNQRPNGLIVKSLDSEKTRFVSMRLHTFTSLENIAIYTHDDSTELKIVLLKMLELEEQEPPVDPKGASKDDLYAYLEKIVPDFDKERVYPSDIKKLIRWFYMLKEKDIIKPDEPDSGADDNKKAAEQSDTAPSDKAAAPAED